MCCAHGPNGTRCRVTTRFGRLEVSGSDDNEVLAVYMQVHRLRMQTWAAWRAGSFYLLCFTVISVIYLAIARMVVPWLVPVVLPATLVGFVVLGALQQRQDGQLSEHGLITLLKAALRTARPHSEATPPDSGASSPRAER